MSLHAPLCCEKRLQRAPAACTVYSIMCTQRLSAFCTVEHRGRHAEVCEEVLQQPEVHQLLLLRDSPQTRRGAAVKGQGELRLSPLLLCILSLVNVLSVDQRPCVLQQKAPADGAEVGLPPKRARLEEDPHCEPAEETRRGQGAADRSLIPPILAECAAINVVNQILFVFEFKYSGINLLNSEPIVTPIFKIMSQCLYFGLLLLVVLFLLIFMWIKEANSNSLLSLQTSANLATKI